MPTSSKLFVDQLRAEVANEINILSQRNSQNRYEDLMEIVSHNLLPTTVWIYIN